MLSTSERAEIDSLRVRWPGVPTQEQATPDLGVCPTCGKWSGYVRDVCNSCGEEVWWGVCVDHMMRWRIWSALAERAGFRWGRTYDYEAIADRVRDFQDVEAEWQKQRAGIQP